MTVEHRHWRRSDIALEMRLFHRKRPLGCFRTRNISVDGLFLEAPWLRIAPDEMVELRWDCGETHLMKGLVRHRSQAGFGLWLLGAVPGAYLSRGSTPGSVDRRDRSQACRADPRPRAPRPGRS